MGSRTKSRWLNATVLGCLSAITTMAHAGFPLWLDSPKRSNPLDPKGAFYTPVVPIAPFNTPTSTPTSGGAPATATPTPTATATATSSAPGWPVKYEDLESGTGTTFYDGAAAGASVASSLSTAAAHGGAKSAFLAVNTAAAGAGLGWAYSGFGTNYAPVNAMGATRLQFWVKTDQALSFKVSIKEGTAPKEEWVSSNVALSASAAWQLVDLPLASGWTIKAPVAGGNSAMDLDNIEYFNVTFGADIPAALVYVDDIAFSNASVPTPTPTATLGWPRKYEDLEAAAGTSFFDGVAAGGSITSSLSTGASHGGAKSALFAVNTAAAGAGLGWAYSGFGTNYAPVNAIGATRLQFWVKTNQALNFTVSVKEGTAPKEEWVSAGQSLSSSPVWQLVDIPLASGWTLKAPVAGGNSSMDLDNVEYFNVNFGADIPAAQVYLDDVAFSNGASSTATPTSTFTAPPGSSATPTATATATPTSTSTPTSTATPGAGWPVKYEDLEAVAGTTFYDGAAAGASIVSSVSAAASHGGAKSALFSVNTAAAGAGLGWAYAGFGTNYATVNAIGATRLQFWVKTDQAISFKASIKEGTAPKEEWVSANQSLPASAAWQLVDLPLASGWTLKAPVAGGNSAMDLDNLEYFNLTFGADIPAAQVYVDDVQFGNAVVPTATPTSTPSWPRRYEDLEAVAGTSFFDGVAAGGSITSSVSAAAAHGGAKSALFSVNTAAAGAGLGWAYSGFGTNYATVNVAGATRLQFWVKTDQALSFTVSIKEGTAPKEEWISAGQTLGASAAWQLVDIPLPSGWTLKAPVAGGNSAMDLDNVEYFNVTFGADIPAAMVYVDDVSFNNN